MVVDNASRIAASGECLRVSVEEEQARELLVCGVLLKRESCTCVDRSVWSLGECRTNEGDLGSLPLPAVVTEVPDIVHEVSVNVDS